MLTEHPACQKEFNFCLPDYLSICILAVQKVRGGAESDFTSEKEIQGCQMLSNFYLQHTKCPISPSESSRVTREI